jgi:hypothetical protein
MSLYKSTHTRLGGKMRGLHAVFPWLLKYDTDVAVRLWNMREALYESRATA